MRAPYTLERASALARAAELPSHLGQHVLALALEALPQLEDPALALFQAFQSGRELARLDAW